MSYSFEGVVFDLDGVITKTALVHSAAWKKMFDEYLKEREKRHNEPFCEFWHQEDYLPYVDGKPRYKGVESFLKSRNINIPFGEPTDAIDKETICGLGNKKDALFNSILETEGVEVYESTIELIKNLKKAGIKVGVASSSKNCKTVLDAAKIIDLFETRVDGVVSAELKLKGKPEPDIFTTACDNLKVDYDKAVVVEDAVSGVEAGAKGNFGFVIGVAREENQRELKLNGADKVVTDLAEIDIEGIEDWFRKGLEEDKWSLNYYDYDAKKERSREAMLTVGNGYFGTRGAMEECSANAVNYPGTYIAGVYNKLDSVVGGRTVTNEDLVNCPNWLPVTFRIDDDEWFDINSTEILDIQRKLNFRNGLLYRNLLAKDKKGRVSRIESWRFASMEDEHIGGLRYRVTPQNYSGKITFRTGLDGNIINAGVERYKELNSKHLEPIEQGAEGNLSWMTVRTNQSDIKIGVTCRIEMLDKMYEAGSMKYEINKGHVDSCFDFNIKENEGVGFEKIVSINALKEISSTQYAIRNTQYDIELKRSEAAWKKLWEKMDIKIEGDRFAQKLIRLHLYHMLVSASSHNVNIDAGITARGLHGEAYRGHIFWDELFILPMYDLHFKDTAKSLLMYRYRRLDKAREYAKQFGYKGAMFPWQSGSDGTEETQTLHLNPVSGEWGDDYSSLQRHVSLAIAYNIWQYFYITNDIEFIENYGAEMFFEICRFWANKCNYNDKTGRYEIKNVMGPDEFHEQYHESKEGGLKDNAYTNIMAVWAFKKAKEIYGLLKPEARKKIVSKINLSDDELANWEDITKKINVVISDEGIIAQYDGYFELKELDWDYYKQKYGNIYRMDRILKAEGKSPDEYKVSKQADVLMTFYNLDEDEVKTILKDLGYKPDKNLLKKNFDYYFKRTSHGSTLSRVVHSYLANRLGDREAGWQLYMEALSSDYLDIQGGTTGEGIHTGVMASTVMLTLLSFAGLRLNGKEAEVKPNLPKHWKSIKFNIDFRGKKYNFVVNGENVKVN